MDKPPAPPDQVIPFDTVLDAERAYIENWRAQTGRAGKPGLTGLALSGGGIRSAVFCLGVIQALAKNNVLRRFDYLSTVSGGGYIGASLTWFTSTTANFGVDATSLPYGIDDPTQPPPKMPPGKPLLPYLRRHGSYLTPDGDRSLLAGIGVVLRGLVLNLLVVWLPIITAVFVIGRLTYQWAAHDCAWLYPWTAAAIVAALFTAAAVFYSLYSGYRAIRHEGMPYSFRRHFERSMPYILWPLGAFLVLASLPYVDAEFAALTPGTFMTIAGGALGVWSRLVPQGNTTSSIPAWIGPIAAALLLYGLGLMAYGLAGYTIDGSLPWPCLAFWFVLALAAGWFVDLNETTLHRFYRDRLMEAFMPDLDGNGLPLDGEAGKANAGPLCAMCSIPKAPYHLINAHLVLTSVAKGDLSKGWADRWRIRGGDSFVFAPLYSGGTAARWHSTANNKALSKISLATAMAISGAAVNPDAASAGVGPQRNTIFAVLMALLNIRLGYWLPNPTFFANREHASAPNHFNPGARGVIDRLTRTSKYLEITDGGNFENLGVYELLRRGVRTIVVCDATADPGSAFSDLLNLLSRAEADFGVTITFPDPPLGPLMPTPGQARFPLGVPFATNPFVVGAIRYKNAAAGTLYYIKPAIFDGLQLNVLGFKGAFPAFPDDSTADQFFDEARFEAYRELGFACVERMLANADISNCLQSM
jgi:hypothetical protein